MHSPLAGGCSLLPGLEECDRDLRAWNSIWNTRRVARELADEHHGPCLGRRLGGLAELRGLEVDRRFGLWLMPTYFQSHGQTESNPRVCLINVIGKVISPASNG
jgi:hypothetical protein